MRSGYLWGSVALFLVSGLFAAFGVYLAVGFIETRVVMELLAAGFWFGMSMILAVSATMFIVADIFRELPDVLINKPLE